MSEEDKILAEEMDAISAMLLLGDKYHLQAEIINTYTDLIRRGDSILDACGRAVCEWVK